MCKFEMPVIYFFNTKKKAFPKAMNYPGQVWKQQVLQNAYAT